MNKKEILQELVGVHNTLYGMQVTGDSIIFMAQALITLRGIIKDVSQEVAANENTEGNNGL